MAQPLTDAINALTQYANSVTGASDQTLSEAVATLASGYGGGGGFSLMDVLNGDVNGELTGTIVGQIRQNALYGQKITKVDISVTDSGVAIGSNAFSNCKQLTSINVNFCRAGSNVFDSCIALETVNIEGLYLSTYTFYQCTGLKTAVYKDMHGKTIEAAVFQKCTALEKVDISNCPTIGANVFQACTSLQELVLRRTGAITALLNANGFGGINRAVTVYVPSALKSTYESATNWSSVTGATLTFANLEGSAYETHYVDGTPIE